MIRFIILIYIVYVLSMVIHELFHYITLKLLKKNIQGVYIGEKWHVIKVGDIYISPIIFSAYISIDEQEVSSMKKYQIVIFFLSGIIGNLFLIFLSYSSNSIVATILFYINVSAVIGIFIPSIERQNDFYLMIKYLRDIQR